MIYLRRQNRLMIGFILRVGSLFLSGCGVNEPTAQDVAAMISDSQLNQLEVSGKDQPLTLEIETVTIDRQTKTGRGEYLTYVDVLLGNELLEAAITFRLDLMHFRKDGWHIEESELAEKVVFSPRSRPADPIWLP